MITRKAEHLDQGGEKEETVYNAGESHRSCVSTD
jgi:hypothetical protein